MKSIRNEMDNIWNVTLLIMGQFNDNYTIICDYVYIKYIFNFNW